MYCKKCGGKIESYASHCPFCGEALAQNSVQATYTSSNSSAPVEHKSIGQWIGVAIVTSIPLLGFILLLIWAFGDGSKNDPTFRNWARAQLIIMIIVTVLSVVLIVVTFLALGPLLEMDLSDSLYEAA